MTISFFDRVENVVGKGENTGYQHFLFRRYFEKASFPGVSKGVIVWELVSTIYYLANKVRNKETNEQMQSRNTATGQDLNPDWYQFLKQSNFTEKKT